eukprot:7114106-Lingulodinium_polyedra.AAC.1
MSLYATCRLFLYTLVAFGITLHVLVRTASQTARCYTLSAAVPTDSRSPVGPARESKSWPSAGASHPPRPLPASLRPALAAHHFTLVHL